MKRNTKNVIVLSALLLEFAFMLLAGALFGYMIDLKFGTKPWGLGAGIGLATLASVKIFLIIYKKVKKGLEENGDGGKNNEE